MRTPEAIECTVTLLLRRTSSAGGTGLAGKGVAVTGLRDASFSRGLLGESGCGNQVQCGSNDRPLLR